MLGLAPKWRATFMEQWPDAIWALALDPIEIALPREERLRLGSGSKVFRDVFGVHRQPLSEACAACLSDAIAAQGDAGAFIRMGSGSFKGVGFDPMPVWNVEEALAMMQAENDRVTAFVSDSVTLDYDLSLFVFPWQDFPPWAEFRLFIQDRKVVGMSQYHTGHTFPEIRENLDAIELSLTGFSRVLIDALHMDAAVADVFIDEDERGGFKTTLIELNPFIRRTDPCLFSWRNGGDFDSGLRFRE